VVSENYDAILRRLAEETDALPQAKPTSWPPVDFLNYRTKNPERYDQDRRRAHFLRRLEEEIPNHRDRASLGQGTIVLRDDLTRMESPYEPYGQDHPLWNTAVWMQSLPSAVYATGQMLANKADPEGKPYPDAPEQFAKSVNTFTGGMTEGILPKNLSRWRDLQDMRDQMTPSWRNLQPQAGDQFIQSQYAPDQLEGREFLAKAGVDAPLLGDLMDATIDPLSGLGSAAKLSRAGKSLQALKELGWDYGIGTSFSTVPYGIRKAQEAGESIRELLNLDY
jgi:hypothetical protein